MVNIGQLTLALNLGTILGVIGLLLLIWGFATEKMKKDKKKTLYMIGGISFVLFLLPVFGIGGATFTNVLSGETLTTGGDGDGDGMVIAGYQPTATYTTIDKFGTTVIPGTSYYKVGNDRATTTAYSNTNVGDSITYWVSNESWYVSPLTRTAGSSVTPFQADAINNGTATFTAYDVIGRQDITNGANNISMGASDSATVEFTYQATSKKGFMPFGGVLVLEYNSTISSVSCSGDDLSGSNPYHTTYTNHKTTHTSKTFALADTADPYKSSPSDGTAKVRRITCQFLNGGSAAGSTNYWYATIIPSNYYVTNSGDIILDVEKYANSDTTRTGLGQMVLTNGWAA